MFVYLANPIDQADSLLGIDNITHTLSTCGISWYHPATAFHLNNMCGPLDLRAIDRINQEALSRADALLVWLPRGVPTLGVPVEIETALQANTPTVILTNIDRSVQLTSWESRGASVIRWDHTISQQWENNPKQLLALLRVQPETIGLYDVAAANHTKQVALMRHPGPKTDDLQIKLDPRAIMPSRAHDDDAGLDLALFRNEKLEAGECRMLATGIKAALPAGYWGLIIPRSSTWVKYQVDVRLAVIDAGYRGELMVQAHNQSTRPITFVAGTRLAQYVLLPTWLGKPTEVSELPEHTRGEKGYGSSGS